MPVAGIGPIATLYTEGFNGFVAPSATPIAAGWSDCYREGFAPNENHRLSTTHRDSWVIPSFTVTYGVFSSKNPVYLR